MPNRTPDDRFPRAGPLVDAPKATPTSTVASARRVAETGSGRFCRYWFSVRNAQDFLEKLFDLVKSRHYHVDSMGDFIEHQEYENNTYNHGN